MGAEKWAAVALVAVAVLFALPRVLSGTRRSQRTVTTSAGRAQKPNPANPDTLAGDVTVAADTIDHILGEGGTFESEKGVIETIGSIF